MQSETDILNGDDLDQKIRTATNEVLGELNLAGRVTVNSVEPQADSDRFTVGLTERTGPTNSSYHSFYVEPTEALGAVGGGDITVNSLKPFISREVSKRFPETATQH